MGQKVNPHGLRVGVIKDWDSRWYAKKAAFGDTLVEDYNLRKTLKKQLKDAGVPKIEIERTASKVRVHIHCAKPGMVIGKGGAEIEKLRLQCEKILGKDVAINIVEVKSPDLNAQLVAENIADQLERRISFRRAMKQCIGRPMKLGGIIIPNAPEVIAHSDGDVLLHALMDALLGAAALGDIGHLFPDSDQRYRGIDSRKLLRQVAVLLEQEGYTVGNVDVTLVAQRPKIAPYIDDMRTNIAADLGISITRVSVKATTEEGLGFTGAKEGIAAHAVCLLTKK